MLKNNIEKLILGDPLNASEMKAAVDEMMTVNNTAQCAAFLALLRQKGETPDEIQSLAQCMQQKMHALHYGRPLLDIVGTGGDGFNTINISTASALLAASCGVRVLKHGNRSVSSQTGSADIMEAFGYNLDLSDKQLMESLDIHGFGFAYAPKFHPSFAAIKPIRKELGIATVFNLIGPLLNPAHVEYIMMGVADPHYLPIMAQALKQLGIKHGLVFNCGGLDEVCTVGIIDVIEIKGSSTQSYQLDPQDFGFNLCKVEELIGGEPAENKRLITKSLNGEQGAIADTLVFNAGIACYLYGICPTIQDGIELAREKQETKAAYALLKKVVDHSLSGQG